MYSLHYKIKGKLDEGRNFAQRSHDLRVCSHGGNLPFPPWESIIPSMGI